ncbi:RNA 3'-terminal phosphate cyclase [Danaus plexippus]|uniref:RNA 3'-terminal phosphate cyclase n=1 Tax=Danaus plexippus plexippus TaxID=278856 RepID=A0A212F3W4_DANPL|nr:RNA 3'-terminal phosphate cyclase [Danaus plexippus]XP_032519645.1 RNA 3'-terminal phosphate cyclase [Danaus plexippus]XP_061384339.1 RNA 3'-terminal phosphate cyclase [Danaus plexippus]OWR48421.1 putative RNA 3 terminal phosphate cyclase [Danaus plexippus plexippus]
MVHMQEIDGSVLEGGGQILRMSISLSAILNIPVRVTNIRAARKNPGLAAQHLKGIQLVANMCQAELKGAYIGSTEIEFTPGKIRGGHYVADTQTAGSISLLIQVALPCALFADGPTIMDLKGGTNADMAPQIDYMDMVFRKILNKFGADFNMQILRRGYFPRGGGHVRVEITPVHMLRSISLMDRGEIGDIGGISFVAGNLPVKFAYQMADGAKHEMGSNHRLNIRSYKEDRSMAPDNCNGIVLSCSTPSCVLGACGLGRRGVSPGEVGGSAGRLLRQVIDSGVCVDSHAQDQVILYMSLAPGLSSVRSGSSTLHTQTAIHIAETLAKVKFEITSEGGQDIIKCAGIGLVNKSLPEEQ